MSDQSWDSTEAERDSRLRSVFAQFCEVTCPGWGKVFKTFTTLKNHWRKCDKIKPFLEVSSVPSETSSDEVSKEKPKTPGKQNAKKSPKAKVKSIDSDSSSKISKICGKCDEPFSAYHAARVHSGLARPKGQSQVCSLTQFSSVSFL